METREFRSTLSLSKIVKALLIVQLATGIVMITLNIAGLTWFPEMGTSEEMPGTAEVLYGLVALGVAAVSILSFIATVVFFLIWLHRSYVNLAAIPGAEQPAAPGWAVGVWFVPIVNLFLPLKIVNDLYRASDPVNLGGESVISYGGAPAAHGVWWGFWIVGNILGQISFRLMIDAETAEQVSIATIIDIFSSMCAVIAAYLIFKIVGEITTRQEEIGGTLLMRDPPQPPTFAQEGSVGI